MYLGASCGLAYKGPGEERDRNGGARMERRIKGMQSSLAPRELSPEMRCSSYVEGRDLNILGEKRKGCFAYAQWKRVWSEDGIDP